VGSVVPLELIGMMWQPPSGRLLCFNTEKPAGSRLHPTRRFSHRLVSLSHPNSPKLTHGLVPSRYSFLSASIGEIDAALRAGITAAKNADIASVAAATASATGSQLETP
jgi:hypothetical protein